jgi:SOS response regulatory protein OraA/RecX
VTNNRKKNCVLNDSRTLFGSLYKTNIVDVESAAMQRIDAILKEKKVHKEVLQRS